FVIADLNHPDTPGRADIVARGRTEDALALVDHEPLALVSALGVPLGEVEGRAEVRATATLPLLKDLLLEDVQADASAEFFDLALTAPGLDRRVTAERLSMTADTSRFELSGGVVVSGVPANVTWREVFSPSSRTILATARITPERLASFGIEQNILRGGAAPVRVNLSPNGDGGGFDVAVDLGPAELAADVVGWRKPKGRDATLSARGAVEGGRIEVEDFKLKSDDLVAEGAFGTNEEGALVWAKAPVLRYRGGLDLGVAAELKGKRWVVDAKGAKLDFTRFEDLIDRAMAEGSVGESPEEGPRFRVNLDVAEVRANDAQFFRDVKGVFARSLKRGLWAELDGKVMGGAAATFRFERTPTGGDLRLTAADAGRILRDAGVFDDGAGGAVEIEAKFEDGEGFRLAGRVKVDKIVVHEDAKLQQMLDGADLEELRKEMRSDGIYFDRIRAPFRYDGEKLRVKDATARGGQIGVTLSGDYDVARDRLDFDGVFTPLYQINSVLGEIPLIGKVFTGGDGQGVFAFTFSVKGAAEDPDISVNPLSVLAPGIFRRIFAGDASQEVDIEGGAREQVRP
ncbi:MAG: AsmA-like C-terminal domain-containing protein, partial [Pseudomonadota bacterium]